MALKGVHYMNTYNGITQFSTDNDGDGIYEHIFEARVIEDNGDYTVIATDDNKNGIFSNVQYVHVIGGIPSQEANPTNAREVSQENAPTYTGRPAPISISSSGKRKLIIALAILAGIGLVSQAVLFVLAWLLSL